MSSQKLILGGLFVLFLSGCALEPFIDRRRNPGVQDVRRLYSGPSKSNAPVVCYNALFTDDETLQQLADEECVKEETGIKAELVEKKHFEGRLLLPSRAYFKCVKE